ncbi:MAG TPA: EAL domain-containing protein, partial [Actinotalea sp.]
VELNDVAARILTRPEAELVGASWTARLEPSARERLAEPLAAMAAGRLPGWHGELSLRSREGLRWVEVALSPLSATAGDGMFVAQMVDVTARRAAEDMLTAQAREDSLTGLANRVQLRERLESALAAPPGDGSGVVVLFCDLDDFKLVNDSGGHTLGDGVLVELSRRLTSLLTGDDLAARIGGDEFVVLRPRGGSSEDAEALASEVLAALGAPILVGGQPFSLGVSIGIAWGSPGASADDLLRDADSAMYAAKREGKRRAVVFSDEHRAQSLRAVRIESELRQALASGELEVYLQPVVDLADGSWTAAEALVRWLHPERGVLAPGEWLDVAESAGLMPEVGEWVLERACTLALAWPGAPGFPAPVLHVNVSARQLDVAGFSDVVRDILGKTGLPPERLVLEFTETQLDNVTDALMADLTELRASGIGLAADDFGTGYSPLTRIIELPLSMIKIDRLFVGAMLEDRRSQAIVTTLVGLSDFLGLALVAEGVETEEQAERLRGLGCSSGQGYLWSRPLPPDEFLLRLSEAPAVTRPASG